MPGQPWIVFKKKLQQLEIPKIIKKNLEKNDLPSGKLT